MAQKLPPGGPWRSEDRMEAALVPQSWRLRQLVKLEHSQPALVRHVLDKIFAEDETLRWSLVVGAYIDEEKGACAQCSYTPAQPVQVLLGGSPHIVERAPFHEISGI